MFGQEFVDCHEVVWLVIEKPRREARGSCVRKQKKKRELDPSEEVATVAERQASALGEQIVHRVFEVVPL